MSSSPTVTGSGDVTAVTIHGDQQNATEDLRRPSPVARVVRFSALHVMTLRHIMHGTPSDSDDSLSLSSVSDLDELRASDSHASEPSSEISPTITCQICLDETQLQDTVALSACSHRFCGDCFERFLTLKIDGGQVNNITCFYEDAHDSTVCGATVARTDIQQIVSAKSFSKFERFQFNQRNSFARQCPHCEFSQLCEGPEQPACVCVSCEKPFCFTHGNAHDASMTCAKYDKTQLRADRRNRRKIRRISKPCPSCKTAVEKNGGCNHMRCLTCSADFCWICGQKLSELVSDHYDWTNVRGCAGQQMVHIHGLTTTNIFLLCLARATLYLIVYPIAFVLTLVAMLFSGFFALCTMRRDLTFVQVFRWVFRVISICGYTALEFSVVTIITGFAAAIFGICWCFHALYKLGKKSMRRCCAWRQQQCTLKCWSCRFPWKKSKTELASNSPHVLECDYLEL